MATEIPNQAKIEFEKYLKKWAVDGNRFKNGIEVGCGTNRVDDMIVSVDQQPDYRYAHAQLVWDCKDLEIFADNALEFIFSSHVLEDFEDIPGVFLAWWKKLKVDGLMLLFLPDIQGGRYPGSGQPGANPSHRTDVGAEYMVSMLETLHDKALIEFEVLQQDTIPHNESCSIDFVVKKLK